MAGAARSNPDLAPWLLPLRILYVAFVVFTWLAYPIFNLMLFVHPVGRHALDKEQRTQARWVGICLAMGLGALIAWGVSGRNGDYLIPALIFGLLAIPTAAVFGCAKGWPRRTMLGVTLILAALGITASVIMSFMHPPKDSPMGTLAQSTFVIFLLGVFLSQWVANWLAQQRPQR